VFRGAKAGCAPDAMFEGAACGGSSDSEAETSRNGSDQVYVPLVEGMLKCPGWYKNEVYGKMLIFSLDW
jgi:hypothetical protein